MTYKATLENRKNGRIMLVALRRRLRERYGYLYEQRNIFAADYGILCVHYLYYFVGGRTWDVVFPTDTDELWCFFFTALIWGFFGTIWSGQLFKKGIEHPAGFDSEAASSAYD